MEARGLHSRIEALYSEAQDLEPRKFNQSFQSLESIKCDVFATIDGPTKVIAFLESWIKDHHSKRTKAIQYESDQAKVNGSSLQT